jgi:putative membrane protein
MSWFLTLSTLASSIAGTNVKYFLIALFVLVIVVISLTLGSHNDQVITVNYLLAQGNFRVSTLLASLFAGGFILGWFICGLFYLRVRIALGRAQRRIKRLEQQISPEANTTLAHSVPLASKE